MGEGRRERSSKRHRANLGIDKSSSDTEIVRSSVKSRRLKSRKKERWQFLEGLTVDELGRYRRRRVPNHPKDTLGTCEKSSARENLVTEYRSAFRATSEDSLLKVLTKRIAVPEVEKSIVERIVLDSGPPIVHETSKTDEGSKMDTSVEKSQQEGAAVFRPRPALIRRGTSLKRDGDEFYGNTEYSSYVAHEGHHRADLLRRPTSLKMEGDMGTTTEQCEKFIEWMNVSRPALARVPTNLKLGGDLETTTENIENYVPFVGARRPELLRQKSHLKLEGESTFLPEYTDVFRDHHVYEKRMPLFPETHLHTGGNFEGTTESSRVNGEAMDKEDVMEDARNTELEKKREREEEKRRTKEEDMRLLVSRLEELNGPPLEIPEYKDAYKDFPRERPRLMRPEDEIGRADGSKVHPSPGHAKFPTKIDQDPEYNSSKLFHTDRPVYRKPPLSLKPSPAPSGIESRTREFRIPEATSEIRSQYVPYGQQPRVETLRMPANLRLEGNIDLQPEYRDAYCMRRESAMCSEPRMHRHRDRSLSASRRRDNLWMNNNNREQFGLINAADEQDAFQVLNTRVHTENVIGKPPLETKRISRLSQMSTPTLHRPTQLDLGNSSSPMARVRSPSPAYRLHVQNVDGEPRGFVHRRSSPARNTERARSPSLEHFDNQDMQQRPYSPSFGRNQHRNDVSDEHAFVVLNNARDDNLTHIRAAGSRSRNVIHQNVTPMRRPKNSTPTNWMPPWYDNTKS